LRRGPGTAPIPDNRKFVAGNQSMGGLQTVAVSTPRIAYVYLGVMIATWAANWPLMRLALAHAQPMVFVSLRMLGSVAILAPILAALRRPLLPVRRERLALTKVLDRLPSSSAREEDAIRVVEDDDRLTALLEERPASDRVRVGHVKAF